MGSTLPRFRRSPHEVVEAADFGRWDEVSKALTPDSRCRRPVCLQAIHERRLLAAAVRQHDLGQILELVNRGHRFHLEVLELAADLGLQRGDFHFVEQLILPDRRYTFSCHCLLMVLEAFSRHDAWLGQAEMVARILSKDEVDVSRLQSLYQNLRLLTSANEVKRKNIMNVLNDLIVSTMGDTGL